MKNPRTLLTYHDLSVEVQSSPGEELIEHMHETVLGTPGGLRYQHTDVADRLSSLGENYFMFLRKGKKMLGSVGFCRRPAVAAGVEHDSWLIRYFSIKAPMRSVPGNNHHRKPQQAGSDRASVLGRFIKPIFANPALLRDGGKSGVAPAVIFGIVERKNLRSVNFSEQTGLEKVGEVSSFTFSRMIPEKSARMEVLREAERQEMQTKIREFYREYTLFNGDSLFRNNHYFVIRQAGRVVAGLQTHPVTWRIVDFGSRGTTGLVKFLARVPAVRRRLDPEALRFLAFDGIYCEPGHEAALYELMEGVLEREKYYLAMLMMDSGSPLHTIFSERKRLGLLHQMLGSFEADIRIRFVNLPDRVRQYYMDHPTYISTYDNS
ncbi:MAG TPA: hypothetical protein ENO20_12130 [Bacteroides sp.]|nr:hypothetical protein [Bacteroides sp.]